MGDISPRHAGKRSGRFARDEHDVDHAGDEQDRDGETRARDQVGASALAPLRPRSRAEGGDGVAGVATRSGQGMKPSTYAYSYCETASRPGVTVGSGGPEMRKKSMASALIASLLAVPAILLAGCADTHPM